MVTMETVRQRELTSVFSERPSCLALKEKLRLSDKLCHKKLKVTICQTQLFVTIKIINTKDAVLYQLVGGMVALYVSVLVFGLSSPGANPDHGHCIVFLDKTLTSHSASPLTCINGNQRM